MLARTACPCAKTLLLLFLKVFLDSGKSQSALGSPKLQGLLPGWFLRSCAEIFLHLPARAAHPRPMGWGGSTLSSGVRFRALSF